MFKPKQQTKQAPKTRCSLDPPDVMKKIINTSLWIVYWCADTCRYVSVLVLFYRKNCHLLRVAYLILFLYARWYQVTPLRSVRCQLCDLAPKVHLHFPLHGSPPCLFGSSPFPCGVQSWVGRQRYFVQSTSILSLLPLTRSAVFQFAHRAPH